MAQDYSRITPELAQRIKMIVADVDGTLTMEESVGSVVAGLIARLEKSGISVGLASGRTLPRLAPIAEALKITGPVIAENGGVAKLSREQPLLDLGYSQKLAVAAFKHLKALYPDSVKRLPDNKDRNVDFSFTAEGVEPDRLRKHIHDEDVQLLDSGFMLHLLPAGISKGNTLKMLLTRMTNKLSAYEIMVFGDSETDSSLFVEFPNSALVFNPRMTPHDRKALMALAKFSTKEANEAGFVQIVSHILSMRGSI
jgi:HAD superfamily hydrolase (TIGR01484 family)